MKHCSDCGSTVSLKIPPGDSRERHVCDDCGAIHYINPRIIAGTLPVYQNKVLLCRRAIEPRKGYWTLPAGFMENGESVEQGAARESWEEARLNLHALELYQVFSLPHINQVYFFYRAEIRDLDFGPGPESLEVELYHLDDIPWDQLAFPVVDTTLRHYISDRENGLFPVRSSTIEPMTKK